MVFQFYSSFTFQLLNGKILCMWTSKIKYEIGKLFKNLSKYLFLYSFLSIQLQEQFNQAKYEFSSSSSWLDTCTYKTTSLSVFNFTTLVHTVGSLKYNIWYSLSVQYFVCLFFFFGLKPFSIFRYQLFKIRILNLLHI